MIVNELDFGELHDFLEPILRLESRDTISRNWHAILKMPMGLISGIPQHERVLLQYKGYQLDVLHVRWFDGKGIALWLHFRTEKKWWHGWLKDQNAELIGDLKRICTSEINHLTFERYDYTVPATPQRDLEPAVKCSLFHDARAFNREWRDGFDISPLCIAADAHHGKCFVQFVFLGGGYVRKNNITLLRPTWRGFSRDVSEDIEQVAFDMVRIGKLVHETHAYLTTGEYEKAIAACTEAIRLSPSAVEVGYNRDTAKAYYYRGLLYEKRGDYDAAIEDYTEAIRLDPSVARAYYNRGLVYAGRGDYDSAIADFAETIRLDPNHADAYYNRGKLYGDKGEYDQSIADSTGAIRLDPSDARAYHNRGVAYTERGDYDRAIVDFTEAIRLDPQYVSGYGGRGGAYAERGDYDSALADFTEAIRLDPNHADAYYNRGVVYYSKGDYDSAITDYTHAIRLNPEYAPAYANRGWCYQQKGDPAKAKRDFDEAVRRGAR